MKKIVLFALIASSFFALCLPVLADSYNLDKTAGKLNFTAKQGDLVGNVQIVITAALSTLAIIFFGLIMGSNVVPVAKSPDVPVQLTTPPRVRMLAPINFSTKYDDQSVVLETHIDAGGRVVRYRVLSGQHSLTLMRDLDEMMYFYSVFDPATTFGQPRDGQLVLSLRRITVRG